MTDEEKSKLLLFEVRRTITKIEPVYPDDPDYDNITELYESEDQDVSS